MLKKPLLIAAVVSMLMCVPLYILSQQEFALSLSTMPLLALSLFITTLLSAFLGAAGASSPAAKGSSDPLRESGKVKWFNTNKGFGFITRDSGDDIFVHFRSIRGKGHRVLRDGQRVEFSVSDGDKGLQADDVAAMS